MIPGHYITGNESYDIPLDFPKDSERNFKFETKIFNIFNFWLKIWWKMLNFAAKNWKCWKFWSQTWNFILNLSESLQRCYNSHLLWYSDQESWSSAQILVCIKKFFFLYPNICIFPLCIFCKAHLLPKRSTHVDQNLDSESIDS